MSEALNVTKAAFGGLREVTTSPLWQYDYGQILEITGLDLPQAFEVHFSNSRKSGETVTQIGSEGQVVIPDMYLTSGADIYCFIFLHDGTDDGETEYVIKIPVRERPEPSDIEPTPEQQDAITEAIAALNVAVTQTGQDVISADASAQAAAQSATNAQTAATQAQGSATSASASASTASTAAATATTKAGEAATSAASAASAKTAAETAEANAKTAQTASESAQASAESAAQTATAKASEASTSATSASGSASAASASASQASESATSAAASATAASGSATSAATSATTASTKASEASASATDAATAKTGAEAAQTAAETAQAEAEAARDETVTEAASIRGLMNNKADIIISNAEGAIATFNDGGDDMPMVSCVAKIEPVQDLHGQNAPYPAGGSINLIKSTPYGASYNVAVGTDLTSATLPVMDYSIESDGKIAVNITTAWRGRLFATDALSSGTYTFRLYANDGSVRATWYVTDENLVVTEFVSNHSAAGYGSVFTRTVTNGQRIALAISADTAVSLKTEFLVKTGSEIGNLIPFENICPISGWTGLKLNRTGKNLLSPNFSDYITNINYVYMGNVLKAGQTARFTLVNRDTSVDVTGCYIGFQTGLSANQSTPTAYRLAVDNGTKQSNMTNVSPNNTICTGVFIYPKTEETFNKIFSRWYVMVEYGTIATSYEPYTGTNYPISWQSEAGTVYGGTLDVVSGVLTVDRAMVDLGTLDWVYNASGVRFDGTTLTNLSTNRTACICSQYRASNVDGGWANQDKVCCIYSTSDSVFIKDTAYTDAAAFKSAMSGVQLVYELATPQTYQLTPTEVRTLLGLNNVWADTGDSAVEYRADTRLYIEKLTQPKEYDMIADSAITSGQFFMVGNTLYRALANIASGATITVGTNATKMSLSDALNALA